MKTIFEVKILCRSGA